MQRLPYGKNSAISVSLVNGSRKFIESSYEWNPLLCGPPLPKSCSEDFYKRNVENIPKKSNKKLKTNEIFEKPASCHLFHWLGHRFYKMVFHFFF